METIETTDYLTCSYSAQIATHRQSIIGEEPKFLFFRKKGFEPFEYNEEGHPIKAKWEMVSQHTARRTFITNVYLSGKFSIEFMMKLSGHTKYDTFKRYVRLSLDEYADDIAKNADDGLF